MAVAEAHIASCLHCQREFESLRPVINRFVFWPTKVLRRRRDSASWSKTGCTCSLTTRTEDTTL
jgi:hypothetical protein